MAGIDVIELEYIPFNAEAFTGYPTEVLMQLLFSCENDDTDFSDNTKYLALCDEFFSRTKLAQNCAYIDLFESKLYDYKVWNIFFTPWARERLNLLQHDLLYNPDGTRVGDLSEQFHKRLNGNTK